jgi:hypothetical protein
MNPEGKLRRLFDLVADTLELAAPNPTHPAMAFARTLRSLIAAGLRVGPPMTQEPELLSTTNGVALSGLAHDAFVAPLASLSSSYTLPTTAAAAAATSQTPAASTSASALFHLGEELLPPSMTSGLEGDIQIDYNSLFGMDLDGVDWGAMGLANDGVSSVYDVP